AEHRGLDDGRAAVRGLLQPPLEPGLHRLHPRRHRLRRRQERLLGDDRGLRRRRAEPRLAAIGRRFTAKAPRIRQGAKESGNELLVSWRLGGPPGCLPFAPVAITSWRPWRILGALAVHRSPCSPPVRALPLAPAARCGAP